MGRRTTARIHGCEGKQRHATKAQAVAHLESLYRTYGYKGRVYHCSFCGFWHVGRWHRQRR